MNTFEISRSEPSSSQKQLQLLQQEKVKLLNQVKNLQTQLEEATIQFENARNSIQEKKVLESEGTSNNCRENGRQASLARRTRTNSFVFKLIVDSLISNILLLLLFIKFILICSLECTNTKSYTFSHYPTITQN